MTTFPLKAICPILLAGLLMTSCVDMEEPPSPSTENHQEASQARIFWQQCTRKMKVSQALPMLPEVGKALVSGLDGASRIVWDFQLFESPEAIAFCLPSGQFALYEGLLPYIRNEAELAALVAHCIAHASLHHGTERLGRQNNIPSGEIALTTNLAYTQSTSLEHWISAYTALTPRGYLQPYTGQQEAAADRQALLLLANAGYDPTAALEFWSRNASYATSALMFAAHPCDEPRMQALRQALPEALELYHVSPQKGLGTNLK